MSVDSLAPPTFALRQRVFQWHADAMQLPGDAVHLARSEQCEVQAFRYGDSAYGLQFHLEVDQGLINRWLDRSSSGPASEDESAMIDASRIRAQTDASIGSLMELSDRTFSRWIDRFEIGAVRRALPSR